MLPNKIMKIVDELFDKTEGEEMKWNYNDELATVYGSYDNKSYELSYDFLENYEEGVFRLKVTKKENLSNTDFFYDARQSERGYQELKNLYDSAQASNL